MTDQLTDVPLQAETRAATSRGARSTEDAGRPGPSEQLTEVDMVPEHLRDPMKALEIGQAIDLVGLRNWGEMDHYERAVRIAEEWWKTDEQRKFLVEIIKLAEQLGGFDHETKWKPPEPQVAQLDEKGRCCGRKPIFYKGGSWRSPPGAPMHFCCECQREFGPDGKHRPNWAWMKDANGQLVPRRD